MEIIHRIAMQGTIARRRAFERLGVELLRSDSDDMSSDPFVYADVNESHPNWRDIEALLKQWRLSDVPHTEFTDQEIDAAEWAALSATAHHGYPQPRDDEFGYLEVTYDLTDYCEECGVGARQRAPFRMKGEPRWGRRHVLQMHWVYDRLFVKPDVWSGVFAPHGVKCLPVLDAKGTTLSTVLQLDIPVAARMRCDGRPSQSCKACRRVKFDPVNRGRMPPLSSRHGESLALTEQWFGAGASAHSAIVASHELVEVMRTAKLRGVQYHPLE